MPPSRARTARLAAPEFFRHPESVVFRFFPPYWDWAYRCQELSETLLELGVDCTPLHSLLGQRRRTAALGKFKSQQVTKIKFTRGACVVVALCWLPRCPPLMSSAATGAKAVGRTILACCCRGPESESERAIEREKEVGDRQMLHAVL